MESIYVSILCVSLIFQSADPQLFKPINKWISWKLKMKKNQIKKKAP